MSASNLDEHKGRTDEKIAEYVGVGKGIQKQDVDDASILSVWTGATFSRFRENRPVFSSLLNCLCLAFSAYNGSRYYFLSNYADLTFGSAEPKVSLFSSVRTQIKFIFIRTYTIDNNFKYRELVYSVSRKPR